MRIGPPTVDINKVLTKMIGSPTVKSPLQKGQDPYGSLKQGLNKGLKKKDRNPLNKALKKDRNPFEKAFKQDRNPLKKVFNNPLKKALNKAFKKALKLCLNY